MTYKYGDRVQLTEEGRSCLGESYPNYGTVVGKRRSTLGTTGLVRVCTHGSTYAITYASRFWELTQEDSNKQKPHQEAQGDRHGSESFRSSAGTDWSSGS